MGIFGRSGIFITMMVLLCSVSLAKQNETFHRSFQQPHFHGKRLNYCFMDGKTCGLDVATRYCKIMGYTKADQQIIANNVGLTNYLDVQGKCTGWRCNGFKMIRCTAKISHTPPKTWHYRYRRFVYPRYNHYRVDWCYDGARHCGKKVAKSFCRRLGYMDAKRFSIERRVAATQAIGNQKLCFGNGCNAFSEITCYR